MEKSIISIAKDFSTTPGGRIWSKDSSYSGQEFYETLLKPRFEKALDGNIPLIVYLDGTYGYATSFLDEAFGRLAREYGKERVRKYLQLESSQSILLSDINKIIDETF